MSTIDRKIYFFELKTIHPKETSKEFIYEKVRQINNLKYVDDSRYLQVKDKQFLSIDIEDTNIPIKGKMGLTRMTALPSVDKKGNKTPLQIDIDAGIYEPTHFVLFPNNIVGCEFNFYGPRPSAFKFYLNEKEKIKIEMRHILNKEIYKRLTKIGIVKRLELKCHRNILKYTDELKRFINYYNLVKPHKGIDGLTPIEKLIEYFYPKSVNNA